MGFTDIIFYLFLLITPLFNGMYFERDFGWGAAILTILFFVELSKKKTKEDKWIWITAISIIVSCNLTYLINFLWFDEVRPLNLFISGNIQIYEMIILGLITFLRLTRLKKDKKHFDKEIKYETAAIIASTVITSLLAFIPAFYREGRFEGTIYYANTCAMFLLAGIALLYNYKFDEKKKMHNILRWVFIIIELYALLRTNSRWGFAVTALYVLIEICKKIFASSDSRKKKLIKESVLAASLVILGICGVLFLKSQTDGGRLDPDLIFHDFKLRQSYLVEANEIIKDYPFGLGYEGYLEHQEIKENKYTLRLVHNLPYQIVLNYGIITFLLLLAIIDAYFMICKNNKKLFDVSNILLVLIFIHSLMDIDFSFLAIDNILIVLCMRNLINDKE